MPDIKEIKARKILDSNGDWTVEVTVRVLGEIAGTASVPQGQSRGMFEASYVSPDEAVQNIQEKIAPRMAGVSVTEQEKIDQILLELDNTTAKSALGANAILGVSLASAKAAAVYQRIPLWKYLRQLVNGAGTGEMRLLITCIDGGRHAGNGLRFQEHLIIPDTPQISEAIEIGVGFYHALAKYLLGHYGRNAVNVGHEGGFSPDLEDDLDPFRIFSEVARAEGVEQQILFGLDAAASNVEAGSEELRLVYERMKSQFPLWYLEDPFDESDFKSFSSLTSSIGQDVVVAGDDLTVTNLSRMEKAKEQGSCNGVVIKPNQIGTLTETLQAISRARSWGWKVIVSHRAGDTADDFISDLAFGVRADGFKLGAPARGERVAKYNRLLEILKEENRLW